MKSVEKLVSSDISSDSAFIWTYYKAIWVSLVEINHSILCSRSTLSQNH